MSDGWVSCTLCCTTHTRVIYGCVFDDKGFLYFTNLQEDIYRVRKDDENQEPESIFHLEQGKLSGLVWSAKNNSLYVCNRTTTQQIFEYNLDTNIMTVLIDGNSLGITGPLNTVGASNPDGLILDRNGDLYYTDRHQVLRIDMVNRTAEMVAGSRSRGFQDGRGTEARFNIPSRLWKSEDGVLYVTDNQNHCIRRIKDGEVSTVAGIPHQSSREDPDGPLLQAVFKYPFGIAPISKDAFIISDDYGLRKVDLKRNYVSTLLIFKGIIVGHVATDNEGNIYLGTEEEKELWKITSTWKYEKLLWIGHTKESSSYCNLARLPSELIVEIAAHIRGTRSGPFGRYSLKKKIGEK